MPIAWLSLAIACTVAYHLVLKLTPEGANPLVSLLATYLAVSAIFAIVLVAAPGEFAWRSEIRQLNWTAVALAVAIVGLDLGFLLLYRSGYAVSMGALVTQSAAALILLVIGVAAFRDRLSAANLAGLALCLAGLWLVNRR
jgi:multidrug transporter EmrE-like cation transporter